MIPWFDLCSKVMCYGFILGIIFSLIMDYEIE